MPVRGASRLPTEVTITGSLRSRDPVRDGAWRADGAVQLRSFAVASDGGRPVGFGELQWLRLRRLLPGATLCECGGSTSWLQLLF